MAIMAGLQRVEEEQQVVGGVDTHKDVHVAAVVDAAGRCLGTARFPTTADGYRALLAWMCTFGALIRVGVEGSGSYGCALVRHLTRTDVEVLEVTRPDRSDRRRRGKSDTVDAEQAAIAALQLRRCVTPKDRHGMVESLRMLRLTRASAVRQRSDAMQLLRQEIIAAPEAVRAQLRHLTRLQLLHACTGAVPASADYRQLLIASQITLKVLAARILYLDEEIAGLDDMIIPLVAELAPTLVARFGIGTETAGQLLVTAGENTDRIRSEAAFAKLCGVAPLPASSGKITRHRLNRGGDRQANRALHMIALTRLRTDPRTQAYAAKKQAEGHTPMETLRCLKRLIAREVYYHLPRPRPAQHNPTSDPAGPPPPAITAGAQARSRCSAPPDERS